MTQNFWDWQWDILQTLPQIQVTDGRFFGEITYQLQIIARDHIVFSPTLGYLTDGRGTVRDDPAYLAKIMKKYKPKEYRFPTPEPVVAYKLPDTILIEAEQEYEFESLILKELSQLLESIKTSEPLNVDLIKEHKQDLLHRKDDGVSRVEFYGLLGEYSPSEDPDRVYLSGSVSDFVTEHDLQDFERFFEMLTEILKNGDGK